MDEIAGTRRSMPHHRENVQAIKFRCSRSFDV